MMGHKDRGFHALPKVSLEDLVPQDHFYRHLESTLELSFVRDLVRGCYSQIGRPSVDPVVFFKTQPGQCPYWPVASFSTKIYSKLAAP